MRNERRLPIKVMIFSLDVGQSPAPSALVVLERTGNPPAEYGVRFLRRWKLGTRYKEVVDEVAELYRNPGVALFKRELVVDKTGVGRPVVEMFEDKGLEPWGITITPGYDVTQVSKAAEYHVPRRVLLTALQLVLQGVRLRIAEGLPEGPQLQTELLGMKLKLTDQGEEFEAGGAGGREDLALATAQGVWFGENVVGDYDPEAERKAKDDGGGGGGPNLPLHL